jgi:signal transduction histidine kinase
MLRDKNLEKIEIFDDVLYETYSDDPTNILNYMFVSIEAALEWLTARLEQQTGIKTEVQRNGKLLRVDKPIRSVLIRSAQELLMNVATHEGAKKASVSINQNGKDVSLIIEDDGAGFNASGTESLLRHEGPGFLKIRERVSLLGGELSVESHRDQGTRVTIKVPPIIQKN